MAGERLHLLERTTMATHHRARRALLLLVTGLVGSLGAATPAIADEAMAGSALAEMNAPRLTDSEPCGEVVNFTCSYLTVPLDRDGKKEGTLRLRVAVADNAAAPRGVLMLLTGGPGQPGVGLAPRLVQRLSYLLVDYRLVLVDQRGTGAGAIDCPLLQAEVGGSDVTPPSAQAVRECADVLGDTRNFYTTADTVADLEDLRRALRLKAWTLDGVSYGTFVAQQYGLTHPNRVERMVLDSVVPQGGAPALYEESLAHTDQVLRQACAEQQCGIDPAADLATVVRRDDNGVGVLNLIIIASIVDPKLTGETFFPVLDLLHASATGNPGPLNEAVQALLGGEGTPPEEFSSGLHVATICTDIDDAPWGDSAAPLWLRDEAVELALSKVDPDEVWPYEPATTVEQGIVAACRRWPPARPNPAGKHDTLTMPVLLLSGDRDLSTPVQWAIEQAARTPLGELVVVRGMGHSIQGRNPVGDAAVRQFLLGAA
jgi:pimeloyl-ACP methyl ester carboxylesterase